METILFIKPGSLGDVVHALPVVAAIHKARPETKLTWVIDPRWQPILSGNPGIAKLLPFPREDFRGVRGMGRALRWYSDLRGLQPDVAIDLQCLMRSAMVGVCAGASRRIGLSDAREGAGQLYHERADVSQVTHAVDRYLYVLPLLGIDIPSSPEFPLPEGEPVANFHTGSFILIHPHSRGAGKSLSTDLVQQLCEMLTPNPVVIAGVGQPLKSPPPNTIDLTNRTSLQQLVWLLRRAESVISVDSGPMHLAAAAGARLLSLHTWSDPRKVGPYSKPSFIWQGGEIRQQDLTKTAALLPEHPFRNPDIEAIAAWAQAPA